MVIFHSFCMFARPGLYRKIASGRQLTRWLAENSPSHTSIGISQLGMFDDTEGCFSDVLGGELPTGHRWEVGKVHPSEIYVDGLPPQKSHWNHQGWTHPPKRSVGSSPPSSHLQSHLNPMYGPRFDPMYCPMYKPMYHPIKSPFHGGFHK